MNEVSIAVVASLTAFGIVWKMIPSFIALANKKNLFDVPEGRKAHAAPTPTAGGIAIFFGVIAATLLWGSPEELGSMKYVLFAMVTLFFLGLKDDLVDARAGFKFLVQIVLASIIAVGGIRIKNLYGLMGIGELPAFWQYSLTILFVVFIVNAYNLIDGIDGLAGSIGLIASALFGLMFLFLGEMMFMVISFGLMGSLAAFLRYNFMPARIFMGDTGSLVVGLLLAVLSMAFLEANTQTIPWLHPAGPAVIMGMLIVPIIDVLQVMTVRIAGGRSPFTPDREHIHHLLLKLGMSHRQATLSLSGLTIAGLLWILALPTIGVTLCIGLMMGAGLLGIASLRSWNYFISIGRVPTPFSTSSRVVTPKSNK